MTANRRIFINVVATYGRSLYALVCGLFSARWVLMALGQSDFGLYGVVGGLTAFITFLNSLMSFAVGRFYAYNVGAASKDSIDGLENCRQWFNTAVLIHTCLPCLLVVIGYPAGDWAVRHFLAISADRIAACVWVWRFVCVSCFVGMLNVPFQAMYTAKQEIAELTIYGFCTTTANFIFFYYMATHPAFWLTKYAFWMCVISVVPHLIIMVRAVMKYPECRIRRKYLWNVDRLKELWAFAFARFWTAFTGVVSTQGQSILVNKYMGAVSNAAMSVGTSVASHADTLSSALSGAFWPAIGNAAGEGDLVKVRELCFKTCRFGAVLLLIFAVPLLLEIDNVLRLWLKSPPPFTAELCVVILFRSVIDRMTDGYWMSIMGLGRSIMRYSWVIGWTGVFIVAIAWILFASGFGMWSVFIALFLAKLFPLSVRLYFGQKLVGLKFWTWMRIVFAPTFILVIVGSAIGSIPRQVFEATFLRVLMTVAFSVFPMLLLAWVCLLSAEERSGVVLRLRGLLRKIVR